MQELANPRQNTPPSCWEYLGFRTSASHPNAMSLPLAQAEADELIQLQKVAQDFKTEAYPGRGERKRFTLKSMDERETFVIDLTRGRVDMGRITHNLLGRQIVGLVRLDLGVTLLHRNPDDSEIRGPHLHIYREGWELKWATALPARGFAPTDPLLTQLSNFFKFCNVITPQPITMGLFS